MRHHAETNLRSVIARADSDLYNNGFLPRTVLRKIAIDYLLIEGGPNRYYPCDSHSAPSAAILMNLRIRKQPSPSVEVISSKTVSKFAVPTYDEKLAEFGDHILRASMIEGEDIETLLDSCILDSERLYHTLSWAGEFERRGLCNINHSLRAEPWDFARPGSGEITLETTDNSRSSCRSDVMKNPLLLSSKVSPQLRYSADTLFYCPDTFCRLLLIMMDKKRNKYCHKNELFAV